MKTHFRQFGSQIAHRCKGELVKLEEKSANFNIDRQVVLRFIEAADEPRKTLPMGLVFPWLFSDMLDDKFVEWKHLAEYWYSLYVASVLLDELQDEGKGDTDTFTTVLVLYNYSIVGLTRHLSQPETEKFFALLNSSIVGQSMSGPGKRVDSFQQSLNVAKNKNDLLAAYVLSICALNSRDMPPHALQSFVQAGVGFARSFALVVQLLDDLTDLVEDCEAGIQTTSNFEVMQQLDKGYFSFPSGKDIALATLTLGDVRSSVEAALSAANTALEHANAIEKQPTYVKQVILDYAERLEEIYSDLNSGVPEDEVLQKLASLNMPV